MDFVVNSMVSSPALVVGKDESAVIKTLVYFDIFDCPLNEVELIENCQALAIAVDGIAESLRQLQCDNLIVKTNDFYHLPGREAIVAVRKEMNARAEKMLPVAKRMSRLISYFPFVEGVFITGSLSKNYMAPNGDIDYLIITKPGRLWLCRGLLTAFKKIFLLNSRKYFCVNYYLDNQSLAIPDENLYTATEIVYAMPAYNIGACEQFYNQNQWIYTFYPNKRNINTAIVNAPNVSAIKRFAEWIFDNKIGETLDSRFYGLFVQHWRRKFKNVDETTFELNFRSRKNVSKHHPNGFQHKTLVELERRIKQFESNNNLILA
jgi:hypothetical protein